MENEVTLRAMAIELASKLYRGGMTEYHLGLIVDAFQQAYAAGIRAVVVTPTGEDGSP